MTTIKSLWTTGLPFVIFAALCSTLGCPDPEETTDVDAGPADSTPENYCPGLEGCLTNDGTLMAGAAAVAFTPQNFEIANPLYLKNDRPDYCEPGLPDETETRCGELKNSIIYDDCGFDAICYGTDAYIEPDADGSEGDGKPDYFLDCGRDRLCPTDEGYVAPDADGTEGDGIFQGLWIAGYGNNRPAMGVKDDLWARAVVFSQGETTVALVTVDAVGLFYDEEVRIREKIAEERPGAVDLVIVQSTHTHEAPDTLGQWGLEDPYTGLQLGHGRDEGHMEALRSSCVEAVVTSLDQLQEATMRVGTKNTRVAGFLHDSRDPQIFNDTMTVIQVDAASSGDAIATLVNWGNHPEILDSRNNYISSDYAHALRQSLENGLPATDTLSAREGLGGVAIYQQGTVGGLMGPNGFEITGRDQTVYENRYKTFARCDAYGELLAEEAFSALDNAEPIAPDGLRFSAQTYDAPVKNQIFHVAIFNGWFDRALYQFDRDLPIQEGNLPNLRTEVALIYLGPVAWLTAPGELFPESFVGYSEEFSFDLPQTDENNENPPDLSAAPEGPYINEKMGAAYPILLGLAQDEIGYIVPTYDFKLHEASPWLEEPLGDHYEETNSIGPDSHPLMEKIHQLLFDFENGRANQP
jgi:hypothetical protein